jgi:hypothetical protein
VEISHSTPPESARHWAVSRQPLPYRIIEGLPVICSFSYQPEGVEDMNILFRDRSSEKERGCGTRQITTEVAEHS